MVTQTPPVAVNREGFRAISQVQLANKKTEREMDWASLKAKTWPPWKEDKLGFDAEKGPEYGVSQALEAIHKAREAGYGSKSWEQVAAVLAGFDSDNSPTIQTRAYVLHQQISGNKEDKQKAFLIHLWYARIRATRTVQEAWARFLAYEEEMPAKQTSHQLVYLAMFEKLHSAYRLGQGIAKQTRKSSYGGDAIEVLPIRKSPKEQTYVRMQPPSMDELADRMYAVGIVPVSQCLNFLVANAHTATDGLKYLTWASQLLPQLESLLYPSDSLDSRLQDVSRKTFEAYVQFLCRYDNAARLLKDRARAQERPIPRNLNHPAALVAYRLLRSRPNNTHLAWYSVAQRMTTTRLPYELHRMTSSNPDILALERWSLVQSVIQNATTSNEAGLDTKLFLLLNQAITPAVLAAYKIQAQTGSQSAKTNVKSKSVSVKTSSRLAETLVGESHKKTQSALSKDDVRQTPDAGAVTVADRLLRDSPVMLHNKFVSIFGDIEGRIDTDDSSSIAFGDGRTSRRQNLLSIPFPAVLHAYMRSLGMLRDWNEMKRFVGWLVDYQQDINEATEMTGNGFEMRRKMIVAARVFLERTWLLYQQSVGRAPTANVDSGAPSEVIEQIKASFAHVDGWGGWPCDKEAHEYCFAAYAGEFPRK
ncbi:MAG: hypothetical protein Q9162_005736 [Coniocarpon cinnabarinum]